MWKSAPPRPWRTTAPAEQRLREVLESVQVDEARLLTEAAILPTRSPWTRRRCASGATSPRCVQLETGPPWAGKLDFLIQEFNRETNTTAPSATTGDHPDRCGHESGDREDPRADPEHRVGGKRLRRSILVSATWCPPPSWWCCQSDSAPIKRIIQDVRDKGLSSTPATAGGPGPCSS